MSPTPKTQKKRLDQLLIERGLVDSRQRARALILAGRVTVAGQKMDKAGALIVSSAAIELAGEPLRYASRGGLKLEGALADFTLSVSGKVCLDVGTSTGGFTDCLLQHGAARVYAVDVNIAQLAGKLQQDPRVIPVERNARFLKPGDLDELADFITVDLAFISVTKVLPALVPLARPGADFLILIKPQFELERGQVGRGGIVRDARLHQAAIEHVEQAAAELDLRPQGVRPSRLLGAEGNQEFFLHARRGC